MKKSTLLLFAVFMSFYSFSQIKKIKDTSVMIGKVQHISCKKSNDLYTFTYNDHKFTHINDFKSFSLNEKDFNDLFSVIMDGFKDNPKEDLEIETPNDILVLGFSKNLGVASMNIIHFVNKNSEVAGLTRYLTKKQVIKLFGKKK